MPRSFFALIALSLVSLLGQAKAGTLEELILKGDLPRIPVSPDTVVKVDDIEQNGRVTTVFYSERRPKTRTAIHSHDFAGVTCLTEGEMTLYLEGQAPQTKTAGDCYYMPSGERMIGYNSGEKVAKFFDYFNYEKNGRMLTVLEEADCSNSVQLQEFCVGNPYVRDQ